MRARWALPFCLLASCASPPSEREGAPWMGKPVSELIAQVGEPDMLIPGPLMMQAFELSDKYGSYIDDSPYKEMLKAPYTSDGKKPYTTYYYGTPKLRHMAGRFDGSFHIAVDDAGIIRSYGSSYMRTCPGNQKTFSHWVAGYANPKCVIKE